MEKFRPVVMNMEKSIKDRCLEIENIRKSFPVSGRMVRLSLFEKNDISDSYVDWLNDCEVVKYSNQRFITHTVESCTNYFQSFEKSLGVFLRLSDLKTNSMIGTMTIYSNLQHGVADMGIMLGDRSVWGEGYGFEAWNLAMTTLLEKTRLRKITGGTLSCNLGMLSIMKRAGMVEDGIRVAQEIIDGQSFDVIHMAKFR